MLNYDTVFQHAVATVDFTGIMNSPENNPKVDTQSESFRLVLELSIKNGEEEVFSRLLRHIPNLTLRARSQAVEHSRQHLILQGLGEIMRQLTTGVVTEAIFTLFCYYALSHVLLYSALHSSGIAREGSAWWYDYLHTSASPFSVWISLLVFYGMKQRFSREFLLDSLDSGLVFLLLAI